MLVFTQTWIGLYLNFASGKGLHEGIVIPTKCFNSLNIMLTVAFAYTVINFINVMDIIFTLTEYQFKVIPNLIHDW